MVAGEKGPPPFSLGFRDLSPTFYFRLRGLRPLFSFNNNANCIEESVVEHFGEACCVFHKFASLPRSSLLPPPTFPPLRVAPWGLRSRDFRPPSLCPPTSNLAHVHTTMAMSLSGELRRLLAGSHLPYSSPLYALSQAIVCDPTDSELPAEVVEKLAGAQNGVIVYFFGTYMVRSTI